ncbi:DUF2625 family protein [Fodinicola acaciae]|uniref:DUF2625 family protein n=1 Tax=Fodinicola acaciae TaxID=2681555 RepID=UPI0013D110F3|nr:DUF2625 family protein [Fodinicola acaciae]
MRDVAELTQVLQSAWPEIMEDAAASPGSVRLLLGDRGRGGACLMQLQVTVRSALGAMTFHSGGILVDHGWLRIYGGSSGADGLPNLATVNGFPAEPDQRWQHPPGLVVGHDILGGVFAINTFDCTAAGRPGTPGDVIYFGPHTLRWQSLDIGYGSWLSWALSGRTANFYRNLRWPGWEAEMAAVGLDQGLSIVPFIWTAEAQERLAETSRRPVSLHELISLGADVSRRLGQPDPGFLGLY